MLQAQIPVQPRGAVLLDDEARAAGISAAGGAGLGRRAEVALAPVLV
jgi:hypothetical protein